MDKSKINYQTLNWVLAILVSVIVVAALLTGLWAGQYLAFQPIRSAFDLRDELNSLGIWYPEVADRKAVSLSFLDPESALANMDNIAFSIRPVLTPFVGSGADPGIHLNAEINSFQFRTSHDVMLPKPPHVVRLFLIGGSTAWGSGAPSQGTTIASYIEQGIKEQLSPLTGKIYEVFTVAMPAWVSTHERIMIENRVSELEPDLVLSFSGVNDIIFGSTGHDVFWFRNYPDEYFYKLVNHIYNKFEHGSMREVIEITKGSVGCPKIAQSLTKNVKLARYALSLIGVPYYFFLQPVFMVTEKPLTKHEKTLFNKDEKVLYLECYREIHNSLLKLTYEDFAFVDLSTIFDNEKAQIFIDGVHFGDRGNKIVGDKIVEVLLSNLGFWHTSF